MVETVIRDVQDLARLLVVETVIEDAQELARLLVEIKQDNQITKKDNFVKQVVLLNIHFYGKHT